MLINELINPYFEVHGTFKTPLLIGRQEGEEIQTRLLLHLIDTHGILPQPPSAATVGIDECDDSGEQKRAGLFL